MKRIASKHAHAPRWQRHGADWLLCANGQPHAHITRDGTRWLCYTADDIGDDGFFGTMPIARGSQSLSCTPCPIHLQPNPRTRGNAALTSGAPCTP